MTQKTMYPTIIGDYSTTLTQAYQAGIDTVINVASTSFLPTAPNTCTIKLEDENYLVTVKYTGKTATTLTGITVVEGTPTAALTSTYPIGSELSKPLAHDDVQSIQENISDLASTIVTDYTQLASKPSINYVSLTGNKTGAQLGLVDAETGKGLSTNDYTTAEKTKLAGIEAGAEVNDVTDVRIGSSSIVSGKVATIPTATSTATGVLSSTDWSTFNGKQDAINSSNTVSSAYIDDSSSQHKFCTPTEKASWDAKQDELTFDSTPTASSNNPVKSSGIKTALDAKQDTISATNKISADYVVNGSTNKFNVNADWSATSGDSQINNKPFQTIGTGLTVQNNVLTADAQISFTIFSSLPTPSSTYAQTIALIANGGSSPNIYDEYACVKTVTTTGDVWTWELFGTTQFQLNISQTNAGISINNTALQSATSARTGLLTADNWTTFNGKQNAITSSNKLDATLIQTSNSNLFVTSNEKSTWTAKQSAITSSNPLDADLVDDDDSTHKFVSSSQITTWNNKQNAISSSNMLDADFVDDSDATHKFVTSSQISTWNAKQNALTFDDTPTASSDNPVKSSGIKTALDTKQNTLTFDSTPTASSSNPVTSGGVKTYVDSMAIINASADIGGIISQSGSIPCPLGTSRTFTFDVQVGYPDWYVVVDGVSVGKVTTYTFTNIQANHTIQQVVPMSAVVYSMTITPANETTSTSGVSDITASDGSDVSTQALRLAIYDSLVPPFLIPRNDFANKVQLKPSNLGEDVDGNDVTSLLSNSGYDVFRGAQPIWWNVTGTPDQFTIQWTTGRRDDWMTAHKVGNSITSRLYLGVFGGTSTTSGSTTYLQSCYNTTTPANTMSNDTFTQYAWNCGDTYNEEIYLTHILWQILLVWCYGVLNFQDKVAQGYNTGGSGASSLHTNQTNFSLTGGDTQGSTSDSTIDAVVGGIKNVYAHQWILLGGAQSNAGVVTLQTDQADKAKVTAGSSTWQTLAGTLPTSSNYIKTTKAINAGPFLPATVGGSSSTYFCDYYYYSATLNQLRAGGDCGNGAACGPFALRATSAVGWGGYWYAGARLQAYEPVE